MASCDPCPPTVTKRFKVQHRLRLAPNAKGRDFVVGDLHGHRSLFEHALERLAFDPGRDRVLSVGDLINRGPQSLATLSLLEQPWFHAVLGNHELMLLNYLGYYNSRVHSRKSFASGCGDWINEAITKHPKAIARLAERVAALPLAMHVDGDVPFNVTHSELRRTGSRQDEAPSAGRICVHEADAVTTSRANFGLALNSQLLNLRFGLHPIRISDSPLGEMPITYVGHSPSEQLVVHESYVYIDQGVGGATCKRSALTLPTVLDHRRFAFWLKGVARARSRSDSTPHAAAATA